MSAELKNVQGALGDLDKTAAGSGKTLAGVGEAISGFTVGAAVAGVAGLGAALGFAVKDASDFEHSISGIAAVSDPAEVNLDSLRQLALQLGADTSFSANEAAQGMEELIKAGVRMSDVMGGGARAALDLAAAGEVSVSEAATITSNALNAFGLSGDKAAAVADTIAGAANASAIDVHEFGFSLAASGAVAATVGLSFDDLAQGIAIMGQAGIKGSDAGTSLKTMLLNLQPQTDKQISLFKELGLITEDGANQFFDATGKIKGMADIAQTLQTALGGMTEQQRLATLEILFGTDAIRAGAVLTKAGAAGFNEMAAAMGKVSAQDVANERLNNLQGSIEKLKGSLETAAILIGSAFLPVLKDLADQATQLVNDNMPALQAGAEGIAEGFRQAVPVVGQFFTLLVQNGQTIATIAGALATLAVIVTVTGWINGAILAFTGLWTTIAGAGGIIAGIVAVLGGPLTVAIAAIVAAVALLVVAWTQNWGDIQGKTQTAIDFISGVINTGLTTIQGFWDEHGAALIAAAERIWNAIKAAVDTGIKLVQEAIRLVMAIIEGDWTTAWDALKTIMTTAWNAYVAIVQTIGNGIVEAAKLIVQGIIAAFAPDGPLAQASANLVAWLNSANAQLVEMANTMGPGIVQGIVQGIVRVGPNPFADAIAGLLKAAIADVLGRIGSMFPTGGGNGGLTQTSFRTGGAGGGSASAKQMQVGDLVQQMGGTLEDARVLMAITQTEGGLSGAVGDSGGSFGPFQFNINGQLQGFAKWLGVSLAEAKTLANDVQLSTQYAFQTYLGQTLAQGKALGLTGADLATYVQRYGQVSVNPQTTGANFNAMFGGGSASADTLTQQYRQAQGMMPSFGGGGIVPGNVGDAIIAQVHGGEAVLTPEQIDKVNAALAREGTTISELTGIANNAAPAIGKMGTAMQTAGTDSDHFQQVQERLNAIIGQGFPTATNAGATALRGFGLASQGIVDDLLAGNINLDQAQRLMVMYAAQTNLAHDPLMRMNAGLTTQQGALQAVLFAAAQVNPAYTETALALQSGAITAETASLNFLQLAASTQGATDAAVPFDTAMKTVAASMPLVNELMAGGKLQGDALSIALIGLSNSSGLVKSTLDLASASTSDLNTELARIVDEVAIGDPRFQALSDTIKAQGGITDATRNEFVKLMGGLGQTQGVVTATSGVVNTQGTPAVENYGAATAEARQVTATSWQAIQAVVRVATSTIVGFVKTAAADIKSALESINQITVKPKADTSELDKLKKAADAARKAIESIPSFKSGSSGGGKAAGGPVSMGRAYIVGEQGPELFVPGSSGTILPHSMLSSGGMVAAGGGGEIHIHVNAPVYGVNDMEDVVVRALDRAYRRGRAA